MDDEQNLTDDEFSRRVRRGCFIEFLVFLGIIIAPLLGLIYFQSRGILGPWAICVYLVIVVIGFGWELRDFAGYNPSTALYDD